MWFVFITHQPNISRHNVTLYSASVAISCLRHQKQQQANMNGSKMNLCQMNCYMNRCKLDPGLMYMNSSEWGPDRWPGKSLDLICCRSITDHLDSDSNLVCRPLWSLWYICGVSSPESLCYLPKISKRINKYPADVDDPDVPVPNRQMSFIHWLSS